MPAACGYNPFDDDSTQPSYDPPSEAGNNSSLDEIERARICRSMDSNSNGSRQRRVSPDTRCYATVSAGRPVIATSSEHFQRLSHEFSRAGTRETSRTQKPGHQYDVERPPPSRAGRSRKVAVAVGATSQTLSRPLIRSETSPSKPRFEAKRLSKRPNELHAQSSSSATKTANGNVGFCTILFLLMLSAVTGYLVGRNGMGKVGAYVQEALSTIADFRPSLDQFQKETQFNMTQPEDSHRWPNNGMGLELTLLFAADEKWYKFFAAAVDDWNNSSSLSLATENVTADPDCTPVDGVMKVCNKDWGSTGWNGINYAMVDSDGIITSSVANMNDHYLKWSRDPQKQYVMCHEIGHGFGLPHTDESFWNRDLGNCMDYTMNPRNNMHPDSSNFEYLNALYGTFDGATTEAPSTATPVTSTTVTPTIAPSQSNDDYAGGNQRVLRAASKVAYRRRRVSHSVFDRWKHLVSNHIESYLNKTIRLPGWKLLHESPFSEIRVFRINSDFTVRAYVLFEP